MKKYTGLFLAATMMFSIVFISGAISSNSPFSAQAQAVTVKRKAKSIGSKIAGGGKYVYRKAANGTRYVYRKTKGGTVYVGRQTYRGGKWTYSKAKGGTKKVISKTKDIVN
jgi:hypothetical protein